MIGLTQLSKIIVWPTLRISLTREDVTRAGVFKTNSLAKLQAEHQWKRQSPRCCRTIITTRSTYLDDARFPIQMFPVCYFWTTFALGNYFSYVWTLADWVRRNRDTTMLFCNKHVWRNPCCFAVPRLVFTYYEGIQNFHTSLGKPY